MIPELLVILGVAAVVVAWDSLVHRSPFRRLWNPLGAAMTLTAFGLAYSGAALLGYRIPYNHPHLNQITNVGHVIWPEVEFATVALLLAVPLWWFGLTHPKRP